VEQDPSGFGRGVREEVAVLQAQMDLLRDAIGTLDTLYDAIAPSMAAPQVLAGSRARYVARFWECYWRWAFLTGQPYRAPVAAAAPAPAAPAPAAPSTSVPVASPSAAGLTDAGPALPPPAARRAPRRQWTVHAARLGAAARTELAVHGLAYLGVLLTFVGTLGFTLFAYESVNPQLRAASLLAIPTFFAVASWFLYNKGSALVAASIEILAGGLAPVALFSAMSTWVSGSSEIVARVAVALVLMVLYAAASARRRESPLRYLVGPMLWTAVWTAGLALHHDSYSAGQVALASSIVTLTLGATALRPHHWLASPTLAAGAVMAGVGWVLGLLFTATGGGSSLPVAIIGLATIASVALVAERWGRGVTGALVEALLAAATLGELVPGWGWPAVGAVAVFAGLLLLELQQWRRPDPVALAAAFPIAIIGSLVALGAPWTALLGGGALAIWVQARRLRPLRAMRGLATKNGLEGMPELLTALVSLLPAYALLQLLPPLRALLVMASILLAVTLAVRALRVRDLLYDWWPCAGAAAILMQSTVLYTGASVELTAVVAVAALTVALAPGRPALRVWTGAAALAWGLYLGLQAAGAGVTLVPLIWGAVGLAVILTASLRRERVAGHLALIGHAVTLGALLGSRGGWTQAITLGLWTAGWLVAVAAHEAGRSALTALAGRLLGPRDGLRRLAAAIPQQALVTSLPLLTLVLGQQLGAFDGRRSLIGIVDAAIALAYAMATRPSLHRRPLAPLLAMNAVGLSAVGIAVAAPDLWPSIVAVAASICVVAVMGGELRRSFMTWFAWVMSVVLGVLLADAAGVPVASLYQVLMGMGALLLVGGLLADDLVAGGRRPGEGFRIGWLARPAVLGALAVPIGLAFVFPDSPQVYGWWSIAAAGLYLVVAVQLRAGAISGVAEALVVVGIAALLPGGDARVTVLAAAVLLAVAWAADRLHRLLGGRHPERRARSGVDGVARPDPWLRWDVAPLVVAHAVAAYGLAWAVTAGGTGVISETYAGAGALALLTALWRRHWAWAIAGPTLVLIGAAVAGPGWLALALAAIAAGCAVAAWRTTGAVRAALQWSTVVAAGWAWAELAVWVAWDFNQWVTATAVVGGVLALTLGAVVRLWRVPPGWLWPLAALAAAGVATAAGAASPAALPSGTPAAIGALLAAAVAAGLAARPLRLPQLHFVAALVTGWAWALVAVFAAWPDPQVVAFTALAAGVAALAIAGLARAGHPPVTESAAAWVGISLLGMLVAVVAAASSTGAATRPALLGLAAGLLMQGVAAGASALPYRRRALREAAALFAAGSGGALIIALQLSPAGSVDGCVLGGLVGLAAGLMVWAVQPDSAWLRPAALFTALATLAGAWLALSLLPDRGPLEVTLAVLGTECAVAGLTLRRAEPLYFASPLLCGAWLLFAGQSLSGSPEWLTVPIGVTALVTVELARWDRRTHGTAGTTPELVAIEYPGMLFVVGAALVQTITGSDAYGLLAVALAAGLAAWGAETRVRRRVEFAAGAIGTALVLMLAVPVVRVIPEVHGMTLWGLVAGIGVLLLVMAATLEQTRSGVQTAVRRLGELTVGWE
jgi:hypothetical protein